jgi:transposase-like protein
MYAKTYAKMDILISDVVCPSCKSFDYYIFKGERR